MSHTFEDGRGQWTCSYVLTLFASGLRGSSGECLVQLVESHRSCVGVFPGE